MNNPFKKPTQYFIVVTVYNQFKGKQTLFVGWWAQMGNSHYYLTDKIEEGISFEDPIDAKMYWNNNKKYIIKHNPDYKFGFAPFNIYRLDFKEL